jgi:probable F420-dependent oxidoreductase
METKLGPIGIWSTGLRYGDRKAAQEAAAQLEGLGYSAVWIPDVGGDVFGAVGALLEATRSLVVATGILNLWMHRPRETAAHFAELDRAHAGRFLLGIGVGHAPMVDRVAPGLYRRPVEAMAGYLDGLDGATVPVPRQRRVLAALGPRMLDLAGERSAGVHPYLTTPDHTALARARLGPHKLVAPEQRVVLESDPARARELARWHLATYLSLPNYRNNLRRSGFSEEDLAGGGSGRLVDSLVAWGNEDAVVRRVGAHLEAGADHVCVQVIAGDRKALPIDAWRRLAPALLSLSPAGPATVDGDGLPGDER